MRYKIRENRDRSLEWKDLGVLDFSIRDCDGKEVSLVRSDGSKIAITSWSYVDRANDPGLPHNEAIFRVISGQPSQGWYQVKEPLTIDAKIRDGAWPIRVHATLKRKDSYGNGASVFPIPQPSVIAPGKARETSKPARPN